MTTTIGPFTNVPTPGDPIKSDWSQTISTYVAKVPRGYRGVGVGSAGDVGFSASAVDVPGLTVTWNAEAGRVYRTHAIVVVRQNTAVGVLTFAICDSASAVLIQVEQSGAVGSIYTLHATWVETAAATVSTQRKARIYTTAGDATLLGTNNRRGQLMVEDIGLSPPL